MVRDGAKDLRGLKNHLDNVIVPQRLRGLYRVIMYGEDVQGATPRSG